MSQGYSTRQIWFCVFQSCLDIIWKVILKKEVKNGSHKNATRISGFSSPRAFQWWSQNFRNPAGSLGNQSCVCVFLTLNPVVLCSLITTFLDFVGSVFDVRTCSEFDFIFLLSGLILIGPNSLNSIYGSLLFHSLAFAFGSRR